MSRRITKTIRGVKKKNKKSSKSPTEPKKTVEKIQKTTKEWGETFDAISDSVFILDKDFRFIKANKATCKLLKKEQKDLVGKKCYELIHNTDKPWPNCPYKRVLKTKKTATEEINDPNIGIPLLMTVSPLFDEKGKLTGCVHVAKDITERKKVEKKIEDERKKLATYIESMVDGVIILDTKGRVIDINKAYTRMLGREKNEVVGRFSFVVGDIPKKDILKTLGILKEIIKKGFVRNRELTLLTKKKKEIPVLFNATLIKDTKGRPTSIFIVFRNITERKKAEEILTESEEKYRSLITNIPDITWTTDNKGNTSFISPNVEKVYGYTPEEIYKAGDEIWFGRIHPEDVEKVQESYEALFEKGKRFDIEYRIKKKDGKWIWLRDRSIIKYEKDGVLYADGLFSDITERKEAEEKTRESEEKFRQFFENEPAYCYMVSPDGKILNVNESALETLGYNKEEIVGKPLLTTIYAPSFHEKAKRLFMKWQKTGKLRDEELNIITKDGEERTILLSVDAIRSVDGKILHSISVQQDITERKKAEEEIRKLNSAVNQSVDGIAIANLEPRLTYVNDAFAKMHGYPSQEMIGMKVELLYNDEQIEEFEKRIDRVKTKGLWAGEIGHIRRDGIPFPTFMSVTLLKDEKGKPIGIIAVCRDITGQKETEEVVKRLKEIDKLKDEFLNISTHELKTPLTTIIGLSEVIKKQKLALNPEGRKYISLVHDEGIKLSHIVQKILMVTRYESGRETSYNESFNLAPFISSLISNLSLITKKTKSRIVASIERKSIPITSDKEKISQVIYNFIDNAIKYGPEGQTITISITKPKNGWVRVGVRDQGPGIPPSLRKKLFTKFSQLNSSFSRTQEGTGLGLYICKLIVNQLGGKTGVEGKLGKGSTFYFTLPLNPPS